MIDPRSPESADVLPRLVVAAPGAVPLVSDESDDVRWFGWDELPEGIEPTIVEMLAAARAALIGAPSRRDV